MYGDGHKKSSTSKNNLFFPKLLSSFINIRALFLHIVCDILSHVPPIILGISKEYISVQYGTSKPMIFQPNLADWNWSQLCCYKFPGKRKQDRGETYPNPLTQGKSHMKSANLIRSSFNGSLMQESGLHMSQP